MATKENGRASSWTRSFSRGPESLAGLQQHPRHRAGSHRGVTNRRSTRHWAPCSAKGGSLRGRITPPVVLVAILLDTKVIPLRPEIARRCCLLMSSSFDAGISGLSCRCRGRRALHRGARPHRSSD